MRRVSILLFLVACSSDKSPVEKCDDLVNVVCDRTVECVPSVGTHEACVQAVDQSLPCGTAKSVSQSYDRCMNEINTDSCAVLFPTDPQSGQQMLQLPADCMSVILARTAPVENTSQLGPATEALGIDDGQ